MAPVIRKPLPSVKKMVATAAAEAAENVAHEYIQVLLEKGFVGAAHALSVYYYGYGLEDSDDAWQIRQVKKDSARARTYARLREVTRDRS